MPEQPLPNYGLDVPIDGQQPDINHAKFHKPLMKLALQKMKLKQPMTHRKKRHQRVSYY